MRAGAPYIAYRLYLEGWTQEEIGEKIGMDRKRTNERYFCPKKGDIEKLPISGQNSLTDLPSLSIMGSMSTVTHASLYALRINFIIKTIRQTMPCFLPTLETSLLTGVLRLT